MGLDLLLATFVPALLLGGTLLFHVVREQAEGPGT
jgi:hypothetical protein